MWYTFFLRFIRRRLVLALIFLLSLSYCLVNLVKNSADNDLNEFEIKREFPLIWRTQQEYNSSIEKLGNCRNSVQGKVLIVDDCGFVCSRSNLLSSGCCNTEKENTKQYNCHTCNKNDCCSIYEYCVSCCLHPDKKILLEKVISKAINSRQVAVFSLVKDQFELCLSKCRTDSHSVKNENKYRDPKSKHCYGLTEAHESQRDVINNIVL